jgi:hypothetical protein
MQVTFLSIVKAICDKPIGNIMKKLKAFPIKSGMSKDIHSLQFFNTLEFLSRAIGKRKKKGYK